MIITMYFNIYKYICKLYIIWFDITNVNYYYYTHKSIFDTSI